VEILIFFYLVGPDGLFLAAEPAQSVNEDTDFWLEEVRLVGYLWLEMIGEISYLRSP
jgi:hypothetical protein